MTALQRRLIPFVFVFIWSTGFIVARYCMPYAEPMTFLALRFAIVALLVIGFAAETDDVVANGLAKRARKGCDWIVANDVSPETGIMGGAENAVTLISEGGAEDWPRMGKGDVARKLAARIAETLLKG